MATVTDSATERTTTYTYDFADRTVKYTETGENYSHSVEYGYDETCKLLSQTEVINGTTHTTSYTYDKDNRVTAKTTDGITVEYTYDGLGRITQQVTKNGETTIKTETYTFNANSAQVATYRTQAGSYDVTYTYTYDNNGNILTVSDGTNTTSYVYDSQNQLIRENNPEWGFSKTWNYDEAGNIVQKAEYTHTTGELQNARYTSNYTYGDGEWGDLLTGIGTSRISYDQIGNPTTLHGETLSWEHGRQLVGMGTATYTYDANGIRVGRTFSNYASYRYIYDGSQLAAMEYTTGSAVILLEFTYDAQGAPQTVSFNGDLYYYVTNLQGDVLRIVDSEGTMVARYLYDAYGATAMASSNFLGQINPLRYRGYVYDQEYSTYYLQSRYYDPAVGRFINADSLTSTGQGLTDNNMFAYCGNNPAMYYDQDGYARKHISGFNKGYPGFNPEGGIIVIIDGQPYLYYATTEDGYLVESWTNMSGRARHVRHHTDHGNPQKHTNPHDHYIESDSNGYDTLSGPKNVDKTFKKPGKEQESEKNGDSSTQSSKSSMKGFWKVVGGVAVGYAAYSAVKWGIALISAPLTGGLSAWLAALTP